MWGSINPLKAGGPQEDGALQFSRKESGERLEETQTNLQMQGFRCQMLSSYNGISSSSLEQRDTQNCIDQQKRHNKHFSLVAVSNGFRRPVCAAGSVKG